MTARLALGLLPWLVLVSRPRCGDGPDVVIVVAETYVLAGVNAAD